MPALLRLSLCYWCAQRVMYSSHKFFLVSCSHRNEIFIKLNLTGAEQQETSNKLHEDENKTGIKTEAIDIKEETKLMTVEDVSEKLGTLTRYMQLQWHYLGVFVSFEFRRSRNKSRERSESDCNRERSTAGSIATSRLEAPRQVLLLCWRQTVKSERNRRARRWGRSGAAGNWTQQTCKCLTTPGNEPQRLNASLADYRIGRFEFQFRHDQARESESASPAAFTAAIAPVSEKFRSFAEVTRVWFQQHDVTGVHGGSADCGHPTYAGT